MSAVTITRKGQVTIPKQVRDYLGVGVGDRVEFTIGAEGSVQVHPASTTLDDLYGLLRRPGESSVSVDEMNRAVGEYLADEDQRIRLNRR